MPILIPGSGKRYASTDGVLHYHILNAWPFICLHTFDNWLSLFLAFQVIYRNPFMLCDVDIQTHFVIPRWFQYVSIRSFSQLRAYDIAKIVINYWNIPTFHIIFAQRQRATHTFLWRWKISSLQTLQNEWISNYMACTYPARMCSSRIVSLSWWDPL